MSTILEMRRRQFLFGSAGAAVAAAVGIVPKAFAQETQLLPEYVNWKDADALIVHSDQTLETRRAAISTSGITSNNDLYIRNNLPAPDGSIIADRDAWEVSIEGVRKPRSLTVGELKTLGLETVCMVLQCSGNGRAYFEHKPSGTSWTVGAAGNVLWSGVPIRAVVEALGGLEDGHNFMTSTGGEAIPDGIDPKTVIVERSIPLESAMDRAILAWELNGEPIPLAHGGPLRVVIPGYYGVNNVKYVKRIAFTETESDAKIQATGYRFYPIGMKDAPNQPSVWEINVKSYVTSPLENTKSGRTQIAGVAFSNGPIEKVEVSTDGGKNWLEARLIGPNLGSYAWRPFVLEVDLTPGNHLIASRATDSLGTSQPEEFPPNHSGYGHNGWRAHAVEVAVA